MIRMARCLWSGTVCFLVATCMFLSLQYTRNEFNPTEAQQVWMRQRSNVHRKVAVDTREQADGGANNRRRQILVNGLPIDRVVLPRNSSSILATLQWKLRQDRAKKMSEYGCHVPFLETITFEPDIRLNPVFDPQKTDYSSNVPYSIHLIKIDVTATGCFMAARIDDKYGVSRTNYTLGLGANRIAVYIIDTQNDAIINTYIFHLHRQKLGETSPEFAPYAKHQVCQQVQECDLLYLPGQPCGLFDSDYQSWLQLLDVTERLPTCRGLEKSGAWFVPCDNCSRSSSCYWRQSRWISNGCKDRQIPRSKLKECFASKKLLFIGDSTNRGIMHYIMEQINGTLTEWDKTHNIKVYDYLNDGRTSTSFAYYPQFWLPQDKRPGLEKALQQLVKRSVPLHNDSRTVFVIGGVQWLAMHHLNLLRSTLNRVGLSGAKLVIKSHGAGFHQPVNGMRTISVGDFQTLHSLNQDLLNHGRRLGYNIVDTYGITMARYKDFMQGKCACHFHKIVENSNSSTRLFHVDGDINAIYSEMIVNRICDWPS